jgi:hypothetical protein
LRFNEDIVGHSKNAPGIPRSTSVYLAAIRSCGRSAGRNGGGWLGWSGSFPCDGYFLVGHSLCHPMSYIVLLRSYIHIPGRCYFSVPISIHFPVFRCLETSHCFIGWHPWWADGTGDDLPQGLPQMWPGKHANGMSPKIMRYLLTAVFVGIGIECHCSPIFYCSRPFWKFWNMLNGGRRLRCMGQSWKSEIESHKACLKFWEHPNN